MIEISLNGIVRKEYSILIYALSSKQRMMWWRIIEKVLKQHTVVASHIHCVIIFWGSSSV